MCVVGAQKVIEAYWMRADNGGGGGSKPPDDVKVIEA